MTTKDEVREWREEIVKEWMEKGFVARGFSHTEVAEWWLESFDTLLAKKREEIEKLPSFLQFIGTPEVHSAREGVFKHDVLEILT